MYGNTPPFRPGGGGHGASQPLQPQQLQEVQYWLNLYLQQNPNLLAQFSPFHQNPNGYPQVQQQFPNISIPGQLNPEHNSFQPPWPNEYNSIHFQQQHVMVQNELADAVDKAAKSARKELVNSKKNVSAWKVAQAALLALKAESWLGFQMQQVPSLKSLLVTEEKINAFIHCFVAARRITSLYDLEVALCESEGVKQFEELELGPLVQHPLVVDYFSLTSNVTEVYRIRTEEIVSYLCEFIDAHKKKVEVSIFLDFICKKLSVDGCEHLCVRIQDFGLYVDHIKQVKKWEDTVLEKCYEKIKMDNGKCSKKRPLFSAQKKQMDEHFSTISQRVESFSSDSTQFCGTHIRFFSSSSEDDDSEANQDEKNADSSCHLSLPNNRSEHVSKCPYPSATEERRRLGLKSEVESTSYTPGGGVRCDMDNKHSRGKRRYENMSSSTSLPRKLPKKEKFDTDAKLKGLGDQSTSGHLISIESLRTFITTWKEACRDNDADEVLERMLQFYNTKGKRKVKEMFTSYPFVGLLYAAVTCIKLGLGDNMYDTFHTLSQQEKDDIPDESSDDYINIDVKSAKKDVSASAREILAYKHDIVAEEIAKKISGYFEDNVLLCKLPSRENRFCLLRKLCECEHWLIEQYSAEKFESLGYGEYFVFLEKYIHLFPHAVQRCILGDLSENVSLDAHLLPIQLDVLLSQALDSFHENETVNIHKISELLARQFPLVCFKLVNNDLNENFLDMIREKRCNLTSNSVLFSIPLLRPTYMGDSSGQNEKETNDTSKFADDAVREGIVAPVTSRDAIEVLLKAPMLADLRLWSHWDILFAPYLGSIVEWLLEEVNSKELLCLVTKDGKIIRLDHSATVDSFLKVTIQGSSFKTAVQLLSLFALYGGEQSVPLSLLKCHARKAFEVIMNKYLEMELDTKNPLMHGNLSFDQHIVGKSTASNLDSKFSNNRSTTNKASPVLSRFILDCLCYLPVEFRSSAADVLISGLQSFVNNVPAAILAQCKQIEHRLILHEVGLSLGLLEWVNDYQSFCSSAMAGFSTESSFLDVVNSELNTSSVIGQGELDVHITSSGEMLVPGVVDHGKDKSVGDKADSDKSLGCTTEYKDPEKFIEAIRQEEFGLSQSLSASENNMLEKQHARLGRALHCLSQELYSQDSHFILELVQNADDNIYSENVEPTLTFILQEKGIVVLNNEQGFSFNNIRALCDVGNSTKKGVNTGYIGKKGIGFKSVFRVTDAPEIHSNGFHLKFDISEDQIGFVLPTVIPPCDVDFYTRLALAGSDRLDRKSWKTCIVLPFRPSLLEGFAMNNILSMFSDLHPSLLLFLHRLRCIKFKNLVDDSFIVMRKEVIGNGIVEVALGDQRMTWFVASKKLMADAIRSDVQTTEISVAFTLQKSGEEVYVPVLNQQPVFSFLPLRTYGLKFILQGDFVLPSSREEVDGNSPWNQWLLSEFPDLFASAQRSFCSLPCYKNCPAKAVTVFMSFVPLVGEVHGFFSSLPRRIISKLRMSNCLLLEGDEKEWVPPCKVMRNWSDQTRSLLPDSLLEEHLGLGFLDKDIVLSDSLAKALGVEDCGPTILLKFISSVCRSEDRLMSMGFAWLTSWLSTIYVMLSQIFMQTSTSNGTESDFIFDLQKTPFIPLSDGKYSSVDEGTIWFHYDSVGNDEYLLETFPRLYAKLRIVNPNLLAAASTIDGSCSDASIKENAARMLYKIGVQRLSIHDIVKLQILPAISDDNNAVGQEELMTEYLAFAMYHLQSHCTTCSSERSSIIAELHEKAVILTNFGFKRSNEVAIHFNQEYGNPVDVDRLLNGIDMNWYQIDAAYVRHPITKSISDGMLKWRSFFQEIGVTDFVQVVEVGKGVPEITINSRGVVQVKEMMMSINSVAKNWESQELFQILSWISSRDDREKSGYLLEILDKLWDEYYSGKATGYHKDATGEYKPFKSSLACMLQNIPWIASNIDGKLHYPKDLFHDCVAVNSICGPNAPFTIPKVKSMKLLTDIGLKTEVTLDDALSILRLWRKSASHFKASVSQMSNFYAFLWKEMAHLKKKVIEELHSGPFIFVPGTSSYSNEDAVAGFFMSPQDVYWHDTSGSVDLIKSVKPDCVSTAASTPRIKMLQSFYPHLHDFFVNECGVNEAPPFSNYLQILLDLSAVALPHEAAKRVFEVLLIWDNALRSGTMSSGDVKFLKESLLKKEYTVLPTRQDKWVSLHSSFGLICWSDDDNLRKEFRHREGVDFLCFEESTVKNKQMLPGKVSAVVQKLGIPVLSEIVFREAIPQGSADSSSVSSLVNWVLPYAQRYIFKTHPDKYFQLKQSCFENIKNLKIVVIEKLFYRYKIKKCDITSKRKHQCNCLLQENILYCCRESDSHSVFLELSCLLFDGTPQLHFANFLHMITTMAKSGATEEQTEFFILNSQKLPKLPAEESSWSLQSASSLMKNHAAALASDCVKVDVGSKPMPGIKLSNWPPVDWKTAPCFDSVFASRSKAPGPSNVQTQEGDNAQDNFEAKDISCNDISSVMTVEANSTAQETVLAVAEVQELQSNLPSNFAAPNLNLLDSADLVSPDSKDYGPSAFSNVNDQVLAQQALLTGRLGELVAFNYITGEEKGGRSVKWVNEAKETGLPYDILLEGDENTTEYIEVKATRYERKNWFLISIREWQFAIEKGESFSIAHVVLADDNMARVTIYKNPALLCQLGNLKLAVVVPKQ